MKNYLLSSKSFLAIFFLAATIGFAQEKSTKQMILFGKKQEVTTTNGYVRCASVEYEKYLQENDSNRLTDEQFEAWINPLIESYKSRRSTASTTEIITIPVVVHVIHSGQSVGVAPNITDSQVQSQITVMNNDFRRLAGTPGFNTNPVGADTEIQFVLAKVDPNGNPTNGINRINMCQSSWSQSDINSTVKPNTIWDPTQYLNMWSVNFTDQTLLGYAQFPDASGLPGLNASGGSASTDGVVANYATFGGIAYNDGTFLLNAPYNEGRTMTHEVGHWVGLRHIWGDSSCGDDFCADTPVHHTSNGGCPSVTNCTNTGLEMVQNYMDYTNDGCMNIYTQNQKDRMVVIMNNAPRRLSLKTSTKGTPIPLFANDAEVKVEAVCNAPVSPVCGSSQSYQKISLFNRGTSNLTSATLNYSVNGGTVYTYNWSGTIEPNKFSTFDMPVSSSTSGTITVSVVNANGVLDERSSNNSASGSFTATNGPVNYTGFTTVLFKLKRDNAASETTWNLKNNSGTTLYSGGPYGNGSIVISQTWTVPAGACYIFTINDSGSNGICCGNGNGYYTIKSPDNTITVGEGGQFGASESKAFSINYLSNEVFENVSNIYLYPNPSKDFVNIGITNSEFPKAYSIYNALGQKITEVQISSDSDLTINTSNLSIGTYFINVSTENTNKTLRFIKE